MSAPPETARLDGDRFRESGLLDPEQGADALARAIPAVGEGWRLVSYRPQRFEVGETVALTGEVRVATAGSNANYRLAFEAAARAPRRGPWEGRDPGSGLSFRLSPADRRLPLLASTLDVAPRPRGEGSGTHPAPAELVAHRFGRRAVLKVGGADRDPVWVKIWAKDRAARVVSLHERLAAVPGLRVARVRHHEPRGRLVAFETLTGVPLSEGLAEGAAGVGDRLARAARTIAGVDPGNLDEWGAAEERANLHSFVRRAARVSRNRAIRITARIDAFERDEAVPPRSGRGLVHRDLYDKQLVLGDDAVGVLDWDLAAAGPPALDAGNLLAHFTLRALQMPAGADRIGFVAREFAQSWCATAADEAALGWWARISLLRLACVYTLRPGSGDIADAALAAVDGPLVSGLRP